MKFKIVLIVCFFTIVSGIKAHRVVDIYRSNGFLGYYGNISQTYMGELNGADWYVLVCRGWGTNQCKLHYITTTFATPQEEVTVSENNLLGNLMDAIETDEISSGETTGSTSRHYQTTLSDNSVVDIYISMTWAPDPENENDTVFHATITNSLN